VGNEFYQLWLDSQTIYSCAYFAPGAEPEDLDGAQVAKLDDICRKLRLRPGERLLDIGCGWGALIQHAVRRYGVETLGITLSPAQAELASRRIAKDGLGARCRVELRDYRDLPHRPVFDKIASAGMFEHVGRAALPEYFATACGALRPGGLFLNHGIIDLELARPRSLRTRLRQWLWREGRFLQRYVFPYSRHVQTRPSRSSVSRRSASGGCISRHRRPPSPRAESGSRSCCTRNLRWVRLTRCRSRDTIFISIPGPSFGKPGPDPYEPGTRSRPAFARWP